MVNNILLTGACGFIGHHLVEYLLKNTDDNIIIVDKLSYASFGLQRLREINALNNERVRINIFDLNSCFDTGYIGELSDVNIIIHMAAETHVDNSIRDPSDCILNNIRSTINILELARKLKLDKFLYFSTDEVYGPALDNADFSEASRHNPTNPYSASKSASEMICNSYMNTYDVPLLICNVMNVFGERQHAEKFIPKCIHNILHDNANIIHSYPLNKCENPIAGSRFYIYAQDVARAINFILINGSIGEIYNIPGQVEIKNDEICEKIGKIMNKTPIKKYVDNDENRPKNDLRYALRGTKLFNMGWRHCHDFDISLEKIVTWTLENQNWLSQKT
jgi:dTDP-glucose 4,6-dehydratase